MKKQILTLAAVVAVSSGMCSILCASDRPSTVSIWLQAKPAENCFPASSLQLAELEEDFSRICPECEFTRDRRPGTDFRVVVEDPDFHWHLGIFEADGSLVREIDWNGALDRGLSEAASIVRPAEIPR